MNVLGGSMQPEVQVLYRKARYSQQILQNKLFFVLLALLTIAPVAFAQGVSGRLLGTIQDGSGAVIANATVTVVNQGTGASSQFTTDSHGGFTADLLPPGNYQVEVTAAGF